MIRALIFTLVTFISGKIREKKEQKRLNKMKEENPKMYADLMAEREYQKQLAEQEKLRKEKERESQEKKYKVNPTLILILYLIVLGAISFTVNLNGDSTSVVPTLLLLFFPFVPLPVVGFYFFKQDISDFWRSHKSVLSIYYAIFATINVVASLIYFS